jgi:hypothetical protein
MIETQWKLLVALDLVEVENSKIYVYSYGSLCASDTVNLWCRLYSLVVCILGKHYQTKKKAKALL